MRVFRPYAGVEASGTTRGETAHQVNKGTGVGLGIHGMEVVERGCSGEKSESVDMGAIM